MGSIWTLSGSGALHQGMNLEAAGPMAEAFADGHWSPATPGSASS